MKGKLIVVCLFIAAALACVSSASASQALRVVSDLEGIESTLGVAQNGNSNTTLSLSLPALAITDVAINGETYKQLNLPGCGDLAVGEAFAEGMPDMPSLTALIAIPDQAGISLEVEHSGFDVISDIDLAPVQPFALESNQTDALPFAKDEALYATDAFYPEELAVAGEPAIMRDLRLVQVALHPVQYNPVRRELRVYRDLSVRVSYTQDNVVNPLNDRRPYLSEAFYSLYQSTVSNFDEMFTTTTDVRRGGYLIITKAMYVDSLKALATWKHRKGYPVRVVPTTEINSNGNPTASQIFTYIQNAYRTWEAPPEFVMIVGDRDNTSSTGVVDWPYSSYPSDHHYSMVDGTDFLPDIFVCRLSVDNMAEFRKAVAKVMMYETNPNLVDPGHWLRGLSVAGNISSTTPRITVLWVRQLLFEHGYTQVDTAFDWGSGGGVPTITAALNAGVSIVSYRGWAGPSGWYNPSYNVGSLNALQSNNELAIMASIVCGTGDFGDSYTDPCYGENWIRMGASPTALKGGPAFFGTTDHSTHTRWNNPIMVGYNWAIFKEGNYHFASAAVRGKLQQYRTFPGSSGPGGTVEKYFHTYNMLGDPEVEVRTKIPIAITVVHPDTLPLGVNHIEVSVSSGMEQPVEGAFVTLVKGYGTNEEVFEVGRTDEHGEISMSFDANTPDTMFVTVSGRDLFPYQGQVAIVQSEIAVGYDSLTIDDDASGHSFGNADGNIDPCETIELSVKLKNFGNTGTAQNVQATLEPIDEDLVTVHEATRSYGNIAPGAFGIPESPFVIGCPAVVQDGDVARLKLSVTDQSGDYWYSVIELPIEAAKFQVSAVTVQDGNNRLDPGDSVGVVLTLHNVGQLAAAGVEARLTCSDDYTHVCSAAGSFGRIGIDSTGQNTASPMWVKVSPQAFDGRVLNLALDVTTLDGATSVVPFTATLGQVASSDPIGPDSYGYFMYDNTDAGYAPTPTYSWVEIVPGLGGQGTRLNYVGNTDDKSVMVNLPFDFVYYGQTFSHLIVCINGFVSPDTTRFDMAGNFWYNFFNWPIPDPGCASGQISPFWDDLQYTGTTYGVYTWSDTVNHRYVIEWHHTTQRNTSAIETFEMIITDPAYHPTLTGDSEILFQYLDINNNDTEENYGSVGFESYDELRGLQYTFNNSNAPGAAALADNRAIKITTNTGRGAVRADVALTGGGEASGALVVSSSGQWRLTGPDGTCWIKDVPPGIIALTASKEGYFPSRFDSLEISADRTLEGTDFVLNPCPIPDSLTATDSLGNRVEIAWQAVSHPSLVGYDLYRSRWENGEYVKLNTVPITGTNYTDATAPDSAVYWYCVKALYSTTPGEAVSLASNKDSGGFLRQTGIEEGQMPASFFLSQNYPNPFNPTTSISFGLPTASEVRLEVFNLLGQRVRTLVNGDMEAGYKTVVWDGKDESGKAVSSGIYLYKLSATGFEKSQKMLLLK